MNDKFSFLADFIHIRNEDNIKELEAIIVRFFKKYHRFKLQGEKHLSLGAIYHLKYYYFLEEMYYKYKYETGISLYKIKLEYELFKIKLDAWYDKAILKE